MERIRCPHCNAVNQDAEPTDNCWQCGKPLNSAAPAESASAAEAVPVTTMVELQQPKAPVKGQPASTLEERVAARKAARKAGNRAVPMIVIAVILIILLVLFLLQHH